MFLALDLDPGYFAGRATEHFFYTPRRTGQTEAGPLPTGEPRETVEAWLEFLALTTYGVSLPGLAGRGLATPGKTGLIVTCCSTTGSRGRLRRWDGTTNSRYFASAA